MKTIILAGGLGTRISEETETKPKPMVLIDQYPILWHIMKIYSLQGFNEFILALGYKGDQIKRWVKDLVELDGTFTIDTSTGEVTNLNKAKSLIARITAIETGLTTLTGARIKQCLNYVSDESVLATYGDGVGNINIRELINNHKSSGKIATLTAVRPAARFGYLSIDESHKVTHFGEKNQMDAGWINGGFFVLESEVKNWISDENESFENGALVRLAEAGQLNAYRHNGFWQPMDTLREKQELSKIAQKELPDWFNLN